MLVVWMNQTVTTYISFGFWHEKHTVQWLIIVESTTQSLNTYVFSQYNKTLCTKHIQNPFNKNQQQKMYNTSMHSSVFCVCSPNVAFNHQMRMYTQSTKWHYSYSFCFVSVLATTNQSIVVIVGSNINTPLLLFFAQTIKNLLSIRAKSNNKFGV